MAKIIAAPQANDNLIEMLRELNHRAGVNTATKYYHALERLYLRLLDHPESGAPRPDLGNGIRIAPMMSPYLVVYRCNRRTETISVLRIVSGKRQVEALL